MPAAAALRTAMHSGSVCQLSVRVRRQAEVDHADVVFLGVVDHPLDAFERVAQRAAAVVVEHLDVVEVAFGAMPVASGVDEP